MIKLALKSALNRRFSLCLLILSIAAAVVLTLGLERLRNQTRDGFGQAVAGTDLIIGPRGSASQLVLYSVFRIGEASQNMSWKSAEIWRAHPAVKWSIPISLGDSHKGFPVIGTNQDYLAFYQYADNQKLAMQNGQWCNELFETVIGADVALQLGYTVGSSITLSHGSGESLGQDHADKPFKVVGILAATGTSIDRSLHISLASMEAIHLDWQGGMPAKGFSIAPEFVKKFDLTPKAITAIMVGLKSPTAVFEVQRAVNSFAPEPLMAVLPGIALDELWQVLGVVHKSMRAMTICVALVALMGLTATILASLNERRRELAVLRAIGATPLFIFGLLALEGFTVIVVGALLGIISLAGTAWMTDGLLRAQLGFGLSSWPVTVDEWIWLGVLLLGGLMICAFPGYRAYRQSLADGLNPSV